MKIGIGAAAAFALAGVSADASRAASVAQRLEVHVRVLSQEIGDRHYRKKSNLDRAAFYVEAQFRSQGLVVSRERFGNPRTPFWNVVGELPGAEASAGLIVVGAHYDSVPGSPGADDNASGVAALLELSRLLAPAPHPATIRFVAFANEEQPFSHTDWMGSVVSARGSKQREEKITTMLSLESIGVYSDAPGSQRYPFPFSYFYPERGNFVGLVGNISSRFLVRRVYELFRQASQVPVESVWAPDLIFQDLRRSDQASYWDAGFPAVMVTDTAQFRYPHYHTPRDVPEHLDYETLQGVVEGLRYVIETLAR